MTILNWNIEWKRPASRTGRIIRAKLASHAADLICLTESHTDFSPGSYHGIFSHADYGYAAPSTRRKATLWSRTEWQDVEAHLPDAPPGRFVTGVTRTRTIGPLRVIGICVPWESAHVSSGRKDRRRWQDHIAFLAALIAYLDHSGRPEPTVIIGDMNQTLPPRRAPEAARLLIQQLSERFIPVPQADPSQRSVCHLLVDPGLEGQPLCDIANEHDGLRLSDHRGHVAELAGPRQPR